MDYTMTRMPLYLADYRGNNIIGGGDKNKFSCVSHVLVITYAVATVNQLCQIFSRGLASAGYSYYGVALVT
jgi:hypothetical protein